MLWIDAFDEEFIAGHPDVTVPEYAAFIQLVNTCQARIDAGEIPNRVAYLDKPADFVAAVPLVTSGAAHLRGVCDDLGLELQA